MRPNQAPDVVPAAGVDDDGVGGSRTLRSVERLRAEPGVRLSFDDWVSPAQIADLTAFLLSDAALAINGENIRIRGKV